MKALVLCSGGVDSTTLLAVAIEKYGKENVGILSISYGQKHRKELEAAQAVAGHYGVEQIFLDLNEIFTYSNSSLLEHSTEEIPQGSYGQQRKEVGSKPISTYVPFRNGLFLSSAASIALSKGCNTLYYGAHRDDWAVSAYPDCSPAFTEAMGLVIKEGSGGMLSLEAPFATWNKAEVVKKGLEMKVTYELTWSCYEGEELPCGVCGTCIDRKLAFEANHVEDPLWKELKK